ncbi:ABC transporter permease subunit [Nakamurella sp. YIM 132087]|uniref:ABC transporter permease subunit n=1 Tax=Nakamurella alba TaxID=2665158 RepID=A0A7K1FI10_9ACTN|nr:ABC transporter permease [Nakamurella alba]MTD12923.1 ABC transporter permease subunit [Nakamurella alba]
MTINTPQDPHETDPLPVDPGDETTLEQKEVAGLSQGQIVRQRFLRHRGGMISVGILILILLLAATSIGWGPIPGWWKYTYFDTYAPPEGARATLSVLWIGGHDFFSMGGFPFGADGERGYDNFAQVMRGIQQTLVIVVAMGIISTVIGVVLGALAGYYRGWVDSVVMRFTDLMITLPIILVTAVLGRTLGFTGVWSVALALGLLSWTSLARLVRAEFLTLREREFVDAARVAGASAPRIIFKHILPNCVGVIVVNVTLTVSNGILVEAALSFLNFGIQFPDVSLGSLLSHYQGRILTGEPYLFLWPGVFIILIVLCLNFIGDGLRDAFDPRQKRIPKARELRATRAKDRAEETRMSTAMGPGDLKDPL